MFFSGNDRELLNFLIQRTLLMTLDVTKLTQSVVDLTNAIGHMNTAVAALISAHTDTAAQSAVDANTTQIASINAALADLAKKAADAAAPPVVAAEPAPAPAT